MKIYISADMEGSRGITSFDEVTPSSAKYNIGCSAMEKDVQAVVDGFLGQGEITVCDGHEYGTNLKKVSGATLEVGSGIFSMMRYIDKGYEYAFFIGYHAKAQSEGCLAHTYYLKVKNVFFDGKTVGEFEINSALAGYFNVKTAMVSGCDVFLKQAKEYCPWVVCANTKNGGEDLSATLKNSAQNAIKTAKIAPMPQVVELEFNAGKKYTCEGKDYKEKFLHMLKLMEENC